MSAEHARSLSPTSCFVFTFAPIFHLGPARFFYCLATEQLARATGG